MANRTQVEPGGLVTYTITVTNPGVATYPAARIGDPLSSVLDDAVYEGPATSTRGVAPTFGGGFVTWTGDVPGGETVTLRYSVRVNSPDTGDRRLRNAVVGPPASNCATVDLPEPCATDVPVVGLHIAKAVRTQHAGSTTAQPGEVVTYQVTITNTGTATYADATVTDDLADVLDDATVTGTATASSGAAPTIDASGLSWTGDVTTAEPVVLTYQVKINNPDTGDRRLANVVVGPPLSNCPRVDPAPECATTVAVPALAITKRASVDTAAPGDVVTYTVTLTNTGTGDLDPANYTDNLTGVLDDAAYGGDARASAGPAPAYSEPRMTWNGPLAAGASVTITYTVTVADPHLGDGRLTNVVASTTPGSNCAAGSTDTRCRAVVTVAGPTVIPVIGPVPSGTLPVTGGPAGPIVPWSAGFILLGLVLFAASHLHRRPAGRHRV
ncbi:hypothetical protein ACFQX7_19680 [Luedemannella flava]